MTAEEGKERGGGGSVGAEFLFLLASLQAFLCAFQSSTWHLREQYEAPRHFAHCLSV